MHKNFKTTKLKKKIETKLRKKEVKVHWMYAFGTWGYDEYEWGLKH